MEGLVDVPVVTTVLGSKGFWPSPDSGRLSAVDSRDVQKTEVGPTDQIGVGRVGGVNQTILTKRG